MVISSELIPELTNTWIECKFLKFCHSEFISESYNFKNNVTDPETSSG